MAYTSKYTAEQIEAILDTANRTGTEVDGKLTEVFESTLQSKSVDVSADTTITADEGFLGLKSVDVKVQTSGEGGGSGDTWRYFDISKLDSSMKPMTMPFIVKTDKIAPTSADVDWTAVTAFGVDDSPKLYISGFGIMPWSEVMAAEGLTPEVMAQVGISEITKEQFYTL